MITDSWYPPNKITFTQAQMLFLLEKLVLIIKKSLKFLNTLCLSFKNKIMFFIRKSLQILRTIIIFNSIQMMNNPTFRQWFTISFFPNKYVFKNITFYSSWMIRLVNMNITTRSFVFTPFPSMRLFSFHQGMNRTQFSCFPAMFYSTATASFGSPFYKFVTIRTKFWYYLCAFKRFTKYASFGCRATKFATINANRSVFLLPLLTLLFRPHKDILAYCYLNVKDLGRYLK